MASDTPETIFSRKLRRLMDGVWRYDEPANERNEHQQ